MNTLKSRRAMLDTLMRHLDMVRLSAGMLAAIALMGCAGLIDGTGDPSLTPEQRAAIQAWEQYAAPVFTTNCVACHAGTDPATAFLGGTSVDAIRKTLLGWDPQVVNLDAPESSRVLTKGAHTGPALGATDSANILKWVQAERDAAMKSNPGPQLETARFAPLLCTGGTAGDVSGCSTGDPTHCCPVNVVPLDDLHLVGAEIDFVAQPLGSDLYVSDLYLKASTDGAYLEHPLFASWPTAGGNPIPDTIDRFFAVKMNLAMATGAVVCPGPSCDHIGNGAAAFVGFAPQNQLSIHFKVLDPYHMDAMPPPATVGCATMGFAAFLANAKPALQPCATMCHGGANAGAKSALDMSGLASTTDNTTCLQVRGHVNFQAIPQSGVLLAPDPGSGDTAHPAKFGNQLAGTIAAFQTSMNAWINVEVAGN
jgi:hypothetical protein